MTVFTFTRVRRLFPVTCAAVAAAGFSSCALAQAGAKEDSVGENALDAVTQPLSDLNLRKKDIPLILQIAGAAPYDLAGLSECKPLRLEIARLEEVLGPDADAPQEDGNLASKGLKVGGGLLSGFIPFGGVVRELSGANAERARWEAATYAGVARRSYLKGYAEGLGCATDEEISVESAEDILGLSGER